MKGKETNWHCYCYHCVEYLSPAVYFRHKIFTSKKILRDREEDNASSSDSEGHAEECK